MTEYRECVPEFADFDPARGGLRWEASVRLIAGSDVDEVVRIHAARAGIEMVRAEAVVRGWLEDAGRLVMVAEHDGQVHGYGSATFLDAGAPDGTDPSGWYLTGVVVAPPSRRHGLGTQLTSVRLEALARVADTAWYFVNAKNQASIALHAKFGFIEHARSERIAGVDFNGGEGTLFRCDL
jgi:ribosomal protein S18 acetylase RimI-like enzyme